MTEMAALKETTSRVTEHFDVIIVGAGISGVAAARHLNEQCPDLSYLILEAQESFGGTWLTHKYPGIRSDSDLHTFGYSFKPWVGPPIATADEIRKYMGDVIKENGIGPKIRYHHRIDRASWSTPAKRWTLDATRTDTGEKKSFSGGFLWMCQGYYRHSEGYTPEWPGMADYKGLIKHPQTWDPSFDYSGMRVLVIGSGATAATIVPAMTDKAAHVTMLQRSPTYFRTGRNAIEIAEELRKLQVDEHWIHEIVRKKILYEQAEFTRRTFEEPEKVTKELIDNVRSLLGPEYDVDTHFTPRYRPWHQRLAFVPDADLFKGIAAGKASVVTDEIERFTETGVLLKSGKMLEADLIVTATGFNMSVMGDIAFAIDGASLDWSKTVTYRGMMFTGVPNLAWVFGYFRASWTLRSDLIGDFVCKMLNHMKAKGVQQVMPQLRSEDHNMPILPFIDDDNFNPNYLKRALAALPKRGTKPEWMHNQDYWAEKDEIPATNLDDAAFAYS